MTDRAERAAQKEADHQRWADDGGFIPDPEVAAIPIKAGVRNPWAAVGVAAAVGFAVGWLNARR